MQLTAGDVREAHERLGRADEIVHQRRVLYAAAIDLSAEGRQPTSVADDVLDNPAVRAHLGSVLGGRARYSPDHLRPLSELVASGFAAEVGGCPVRLASAPAASSVLAGALRRITGELERHGDENSELGLLTVNQSKDIEEAYGYLVEGVRLAVRIAPELALDLLPHVGLFAVVLTKESARLGSASAREYPGLIMMPAPGSALEVAEALVHEGAHQKFFDLGMTRDILTWWSPQAPRYAPSWAPPGAPAWPLEQSVAAWHAYHCLAVFYRCLAGSGDESALHADSLLPKASRRAAEIGRWLRGQGSFLGRDAHRLIAALEGVGPDDPWPRHDVGPEIHRAVDNESVVVRRAGKRTLVGLARPDRRPDLYWRDDPSDH